MLWKVTDRFWNCQMNCFSQRWWRSVGTFDSGLFQYSIFCRSRLRKYHWDLDDSKPRWKRRINWMKFRQYSFCANRLKKMSEKPSFFYQVHLTAKAHKGFAQDRNGKRVYILDLKYILLSWDLNLPWFFKTASPILHSRYELPLWNSFRAYQ